MSNHYVCPICRDPRILIPKGQARCMTCEREVAAAPVCAWFVRCGRPATGTTPHPVLGDVLTCDRCHDFATGAA